MRDAAFMGVLLLGCGASPRMVQQSTEYFEQCHAADLDPARTMEQRQACWSAWLEHYQAYQSADRAAYAQQRLAALRRGEAMAALPVLDVSRAGVNEGARDSVGDGGPGADLPRDVPAAEAPAASPLVADDPCVQVCAPRQTACVARCDAGRSECETACLAEQRVCMRACF